MAERDRIPPPVEPERDPTALAAWRRVAEQRRRRVSGEESDPDDRAEPAPRPTADETVMALSRHELLLALAGRIDDDALASVRELVAVEDDAAAADLLGGCLLAGVVAVSEAERAALAAWFRTARVDAELAGSLGTDEDAAWRGAHRFVRDLPESATDDGETVARAAARLSGVARVSQCWRVTPAGHAPGPLPHRVVLVETDSSDDCEHVAHHVAHAARSLGAVSVEVFATGSELPTYQRDALAAATALGGRAGPPAVPEAPSRATTETVEERADRTDGPDEDATGDEPVVSRRTSAAARAVLPSRRRPGAGAGLFAPVGRGDDEDPRPETGGSDGTDGTAADAWQVVADADRGAPARAGWSMAPSGPDERWHGHDDPDVDQADGYVDRYDALARVDAVDDHDVDHDVDRDVDRDDARGVDRDDARGVDRDDALDDAGPEDTPAPLLDPQAAADRIAALWREPAPVDAFDAPLPTDGVPRNLLEPERPEPDLDEELARYDAGRPGSAAYGGSFGRVEYPEPTHPEAVTGDLGASLEELDESRARRTRRHGWDDEGDAAPVGDGLDDGLVDRSSGVHGARLDAAPGPGLPPGPGTPVESAHGAETTAPMPPVPPAPPIPPGTEGADGARPTGWNPETEEAVNSQLSDRERDLLARLHAELASREGLESGDPDPWTSERAGRNGHAHGPMPPAPTPSPQPRPRPGPGAPPPPVNGHRPRNGHGLSGHDGDAG